MTKLPSLSAFAPCYNEVSHIRPLVLQLMQVLPAVARTFEIIIIDDGSQDGTGKLADLLAIDNPHLRVVHHETNRGYGASLRSGFAAAQYDWIFFTDGDLQFDLEQLKEFVPHAPQYPVVIGYRQRRAEGALRALNARLFKVFIDLLFRLNVRDIDCAFKLFRADLIQSLPLESTGAFTSAEVLYRLKKKGVPFLQLPVRHLPRRFGTPTGNHPGVIIKAAWEALRLYLKVKFRSETPARPDTPPSTATR